jgi:hypothetical protein
VSLLAPATRALLTGLVLGPLLVPAGAASQQAGDPAARPGSGPIAACASPLLPADHWAVQRVERLEALGLLRYLPAQRSVPIYEVAGALEAARERARETGSPLAGLVEAWHGRLLEEGRGVEGRATCEERGVERLAGSASLGFGARSGAGAPGLGQFPPVRTGTLPLPDRAGGLAGLDLLAALGPRAALRAAPVLGEDGPAFEALDLRTRWRWLSAAVGRHPIGYGGARSGAVVLSGVAPLDRLEAQTARPIAFPGPLSPLGVFTVHTFLGRLRESRHPGDPYLWGGRIAVQPHRRMTVAVNRAAMFAGDPDHPVTAVNLLNLLIGRVAGVGFEDQVVSVGGWIHLPTESLIPLTFHLEWGAEDAAGAWRDVPGRVAGLTAPALPGLPEVALGVEYSSFGVSCCSNPPWFRHWSFPGSWASGDHPLAHPLGGAGREALLFSQVDLAGAGLHLDLRGYRRTREEENLFAPERAGGSTGVDADLTWRVRPDANLRLRFSREAGQGWAERSWNVGARYFF